MSGSNIEHGQWFLLMGAMLASKAARELAVKRLAVEDVPEPLRELWNALKSEQPEGIRAALEGFGVARNGGKSALDELVRTLQEKALADYCRKTMDHVKFAKGVDPENLLTLLDTLATRIRARQAAMETPK